MRLVIDLQGMQTRSRDRGIGRYTLSLVRALLKNRGRHEIMLVLNGLMQDSIDPIRTAFGDLVKPEDVHVWHLPGPIRANFGDRWARRAIAELIREAFLASLRPDLVLVSSLFEGYGDDAVTSVGAFQTDLPTAVILYDLIPYLYPEDYLDWDRHYVRYYHQRIDFLRRADLTLAISAYTALDARRLLDLPVERVVNIGTACAAGFKPQTISLSAQADVYRRFGIQPDFILYAGGADARKNLLRLIRAYAALPGKLRGAHQLVLAGKMHELQIMELKVVAKCAGLKHHEVRFLGQIDDVDLASLYNLCYLFVFPSLYEGFGLPALEAMASGAAVIGANATSIPEVIANPEALFDPENEDAMTKAMVRVLTDQELHDRLVAHGLRQSARFSWDECARVALASLERLHHDKPAPDYADLAGMLLPRLIERIAALLPERVPESEVCQIALALHRLFNPHAAIT